MSSESTRPDPGAWGIETGYHDHAGQWRDAPPETIEAILQAMGANAPSPPGTGDDNPVWVLHEGDRPSIDGPWTLRTEDGAELSGEGELPGDLPLGYHELDREGIDLTVTLIVAPSACPDVEDARGWGWAVQLYALRSKKSWGIGDLGDLAQFGELAAGRGADIAIINPLHASLPGIPQQPSPYFPSSREFRNPLYIRIADVPGADDGELDLDSLAHQAHALNGDRNIDRNAVWRLKEDALERIWRRHPAGKELDAYIEEQGESLKRYATFCALTEVHGHNWTEWPNSFRHPNNAAVEQFWIEHGDRVRFHQWLQFLLDQQLQQAGKTISLVEDLAIGVDPAGADAWLWQDATALNVRVGAPPDEFNTQGQDWGLPPLNPHALRLQRFAPFIQTVRASLRHAGGLRIDHVMGLFRLYWIPEGAKSGEGTYVRYPWAEMLAIVALESVRAQAIVIGEDLGTVEPFMREELQNHNILSYRLLWFEDQPPQHFLRQALAAITTHDLPTVAGLWDDSDLEQQNRLGTEPNVESTHAMKNRVANWLQMNSDTPIEDVIPAAHELLAGAPSALVSATLEDALGLRERPNYPGTTDEYPNWSVALPVSLDDLASHSGFQRVGDSLRKGRELSN